ncbi:MAG: hypothetical protein UY63_C0022G0009 [Parcubacteria group bacterium GW2011_GWA2_51_10]|nr:MAG: hypothetical protein UY63_C0022G0009 [Parcubacteria group bacterium GW2011_GWA2_51_10]
MKKRILIELGYGAFIGLLAVLLVYFLFKTFLQ